MKDNEAKHILKIMELAEDLNQEVAKAKISCGDLPEENTFNLNNYLDSLFDSKYNYLEDADIDSAGEDVSTFLSSSSLKDLLVSTIIALCVSRVINLSDVIVALDTLQDNNK